MLAKMYAQPLRILCNFFMYPQNPELEWEEKRVDFWHCREIILHYARIYYILAIGGEELTR